MLQRFLRAHNPVSRTGGSEESPRDVVHFRCHMAQPGRCKSASNSAGSAGLTTW